VKVLQSIAEINRIEPKFYLGSLGIP
jgi:hypothetical protein